MLVFIVTAFTSFAQIFYKLGADILVFDFFRIITNYYLMIGILLYLIGAALLIVALKNGELSVLYPIIATSFIWVSILSTIFFKEVMGVFKWAGVISIFLGVVSISLKSQRVPDAN